MLIENSGADEQLKMEAKARKILKKKLYNNIRYYSVELSTSLSGTGYQLPIWLAHLMPFVQDGDILNFGYLSSDGADFWHAKPDMVNAFNSFMKLLGRPNARIMFPLEYWTKGDVIKELKKLKLLKYTWTCGDPQAGKPCGKCMKCISIKRWTAFPDKGKDT